MMKTKVLAFLALILLCGYSQSEKPSLSVTFGDVRDGKAYLYDTRSLTTDTVSISNGKLEYSKKVENPSVYLLVVEGYNDWYRPFRIVLSSDPTEVKFNSFTPIKQSNNLADLYPNQPIFITDPNHNAAYYKFQKDWMAFFESIQRLSPKEGEPDVNLEARKSLYFNFLKSSEAAVAENSDKLVSAVIVEHLLSDNLLPLEVTQQLYASLSEEVKDNPFTASISAEAGMKAGTQAPSFEFTDLKERLFTLEGAKGSKVLLHFWSSTCAPCIKETPKLLELEEKYKGQGLLIVNVSLDTDKDRWLKGISRAGIGKMINTCDFRGLDGKIVQDYRIRAIPAHYLIDENGRIISKGTIDEIAKRL